MKYYVMALAGGDEIAEIDKHPDDLPFKSYRFRKGKPLLPELSGALNYRFSDDKPDGRELVDLQYNTLNIIIISDALRSIFENKADIEFIPIHLLDHRGNVASDSHCIANFLNMYDCIDKDQSKFDVDPLDEEEYLRIYKLVFNESLIDENIHAFRLKRSPYTIVVDETIVNAAREKELKGMKFVPIEEFDSAYFMGV